MKVAVLDLRYGNGKPNDTLWNGALFLSLKY